MPIELILSEKVECLGAEADLVRVKSGYARNYLLPKGKAVVATTATKKQVEDLKRKRAQREAEELNAAEELARKLNKITLTFQMRAGEGSEKVFGSVTAHDIIERLKENGHTIDRKAISLAHPIKTLGATDVSFQLGHGVTAKISVVLTVPDQDHAKGEEAADDAAKKKRPRSRKPTS